MPECPDCKSNNVTSKGYREGTNMKRYICKKCGRNFTTHPLKVVESEITELPTKIQEEVRTIQGDNMKPKMITIAVSEEIHTWLTGLKLIPQEPLTSVLKRIKETNRGI